ncbi:MAG TPA: saccharopine dehydrogenase C-terminal domain-containing protein [Planctomycetota bacterium]|nr:saccharopine dehydrogenase C-terminal domain-containing protein [Planctomycetota bacterium]
MVGRSGAKRVVVAGAGEIGRMIAFLLAERRVGRAKWDVLAVDASQETLARVKQAAPDALTRRVDFRRAADLDAAFAGAWAVVSAAPFAFNPLIAERAVAAGAHYLDLTEDVAVTNRVRKLAEKAPTLLVPQCGLAPGFVTIAAMPLVRRMGVVRSLKLRVGALPRRPSNRLQYNLTWSTAGLVNEYVQECDVVVGGRPAKAPALQNLERLTLDGVDYEAFNTSGGLSTLPEALAGRVQELNYKSIRYPGHCEYMKFLLDDLGFGATPERVAELVRLLDERLPRTREDVVVVYVSAIGDEDGALTERSFAVRVFAVERGGETWTAIQRTTAGSACATLELMAEGALPRKRGFVRQDEIPFEAFMATEFGRFAFPDAEAAAAAPVPRRRPASRRG